MTKNHPDSAQSHTGRIARAAGLVMALFVVSRLMGLVREMVIAHQFGTSAQLDAYLAAFRLPDLLFALMAGGALGSAFIPVFSSYLTQKNEQDAWRLASAVVNWVFLFLTVAGITTAIAAPFLVSKVIAPGFSATQQDLTVNLMRWMLISTAVFGVSGVVMGILNARQHFLLPAAAPVVYNAAIILGAWVFGPRIGVKAAAMGVVAGAVGHLLIQLPGLWRQGMRFSLTLAPREPGVREVGRLMAPRALGLAAVELNHLVNVMLASTLAVGSLSALNYGRLMMLLPEGIIAQSVAIAAFPTFSALVAQKKSNELSATLNTTLRSVLYLTLPATVGLIWLREPLIRVVFQGGAFDADSVQATSWALLFYAAGLVGHAVVEIVTRAFYAMHDTRTPVFIGISAMGLNIGFSFGFLWLFRLLGWQPHGGLALANSLATGLEMAVLLFIIHNRLPAQANGHMVKAVIKMLLACLLMLPGLAAVTVLSASLPAWLPLIAGIAVGGGVYGLTTLVLGSEEPKTLLTMIANRVAKRKTG